MKISGLGNKFRGIIAWVSIVTYLFASPFGAFGVSLCQSDDGHVAFEFTEAGKCYSPSAAEANAHFDVHQVDLDTPEHCGDCTDTPLGKEVRLTQRNLSEAVSPSIIFTAIPIRTAILSEAVSNNNVAYPGLPDMPREELHSLGTIVLLI